ncbi:hypothetical protein [Spirillospora sp. NPDC047279]|uniref:hypothetical protein n=1 Tax=Spirillospora sp. NPDC047279 TaxID=3155478 RepID=UPI0033D8AFCF
MTKSATTPAEVSENAEDTTTEGAAPEHPNAADTEPRETGPESAEAAPAAAEEPDEVDEPDEPGGTRRSWLRVPQKSLLTRATVVVVLIGSIVTAGLQWREADRADRQEAEHKRIKASASEFGQALLSYDHTKLQAARDRVLALASDDFAKTYDEAFTGGLEGVITKLKADATATVRAVYLGEVTEGTAKAVVVMDSEVRSSAGTRRVIGSFLDMRLERRGDRWQVSNVTSVGSANESMVDPQGRQQPSPSAEPSSGPKP